MQSLSLSFTLNGQPVTLACAPQTLLVEAIRQCGLGGTPLGCDTAQCGACTVLVDGQATKSCNLLAAQASGSAITTVEGLVGSREGAINPDEPGDAAPQLAPHLLRRLFSQHHALQCGFCTSGMLMRALSMVEEDVPATPAAVRHALAGNLCRCTGYAGIVNAIVEALPLLRAQGVQGHTPRSESRVDAA